METKVKFQPIRGTEVSILAQPYEDGAVYFTSDTGKIYMDKDGERILMGTSGVSLFYGHDVSPEQDPMEDALFILRYSSLEGFEDSEEGDLILNEPDGCFYKIDSINAHEDTVSCYRLSVSGSGGGGGSTATHRGKVTIKNSGEPDILNGDSAIVTLLVSSMTEENEPVQERIPAVLSLSTLDAVSQTYKEYYKETLTMVHNVPVDYDLTSLLRESATNRITITAQPAEDNKFTLYSNSTDITTHSLSISWNEVNFTAQNYFENGKIPVHCNITTGMRRILDIYFDNQLVFVGKYDLSEQNNPSAVSFEITPETTIKNSNGTASGQTIGDGFSHGPHTISAKLSLQKSDGSRGNGTETIKKEVAIKALDNMPLIWVGDYKDSYYEYETILIPFKVYDPAATSAGVEVHLMKNGTEIDGGERYIPTGTTGWSYWEIVDLTVNDTSYYTIRVGKDEFETRRDLSFTILADPRNMKPVNTPVVTFDSRGRSNNEEKTKRQTLVINGQRATFNNFNWYNNGWVFDENQTTCLRISNGASVSIPVGPMTFQGSGDTTNKHAVELQFKIKNVSDYSKLITNYTRYTTERGWNDDLAFAAFLEQRTTGYSNYDAFLANYYLGSGAEENLPSYDDLEYASTFKTFNFENVVCSYATKTQNNELSESNPGICIGPQDTFFTNGTNTVTADFVEDELINLAFVFTGGTEKAGGDLLMEVYMNGILTSVARSSLTNSWGINSNTIDFNSSACDIDLYKIRIYNQSLIAPDIIQNYAFDLKDTKMWDQKDLGYTNNTLGEYQFSYNAMIAYNNAHPNEPLMPYMIFHTTDANSQNRLPYNKANTAINGTFEFVNTALDAAYKNGRLALKANEEGYESVEDYYIHHCPSFVTADNKAAYSVQGTSSQFYPRRNMKVKTKGNMYLNRGPFAEAYAEDPTSTKNATFYMDNDTVGTDKFTMKIDYMESSGDYNRGFANLVKNSYSKHPIEDYGTKAFDGFELYGNVEDYRTSVQGYPVLAFHWPDNLDEPIFIGRYNMLLDKGSDACYGFKPDKGVKQKFLENLPVRTVAECWEFENNSRGFCSFRDPWLRKDLSFKAPEGDPGEFTTDLAPIIADSFEYRYNPNDDLIDILIDLAHEANETNQQTLLADFTNTMPYKITVEKTTNPETGEKVVTAIKNSAGESVDLVNDLDSARQLLLDLYSNWEKAVAWVWSTATDTKVKFPGDDTEYDIPSIGTYEVIDLAADLFVASKFFIQTTENGETVYNLASTWDDDTVYYVRNTTTNDYNVIKLTNDSNLVYAKNRFYTLENGNYILNADDFDVNKIYYKLTANEGAIDSKWNLPAPVTYGTTTYTKDTKEYRQAKFKNELSQHFDIEYLASYFIMTEIFECYDSRGKNCMMASWGPQVEGGDHIWYPIFYDIDTQLGINNTGIPSFEYYVDATEDGTFSTNDSVLWNNFYAYFKSSIINKYQQLMGNNSAQFGGALKTPLLKRDVLGSKVSTVDGWYMSDPDITDSYAMRGDRPLLAINMDEYYKYITPTNTRAKNTIFGRLTDGGTYAVEADTYFYALQGDRHLYRKQFLINRLNYIDSWLTLDNYARGGENRIRSRISANNPSTTSDRWISGTATNGAADLITNSQYWKNNIEYGEKVHEFDGEYWITMTPIRNSYVTVGTDANNFPSLKYTGSPVRFTTSDLKNGIINSGNYKEQLYYIYGLDQMKTLGDLSKLYFQEFELTGTANKMADLLLGYDGLDESNGTYKNMGVNEWTIPAAKTQAGMPLLKEVNLCNIQFKNESTTFDFSSCEKLENFRNTGSNIVQVTFADGVALNTLYLTDKTTVLNLTEARLLTKLITTYVPPVKNPITGKLEVQPANKGLYIADLTDKDNDTCTTKITLLNIQGGNLGYYSYDLLKKYYNACYNTDGSIERKVNLTDVQWSPFTPVEDVEAVYNENNEYFLDNGHFQLEEYTPNSDAEWLTNIRNKLLYVKDENVNGINLNGYSNITDMDLFTDLAGDDHFKSIAENNNEVPNISGIVYINNMMATSDYDEAKIQTDLQNNYPSLTFFFNDVIKGYSARFVIEHEGVQTLIGTQKIANDNYSPDVYFKDPTDVNSGVDYYSISDLKDQMPNYDFKGWATDPEGVNMVITMDPDNDKVVIENNWTDLELVEDVKDYMFYAIFTIKKYPITFEDPDGNSWVRNVVYGEVINPPTAAEFIPTKNDIALDTDKTYAHYGWSLTGFNGTQVEVTNYRATTARKFYALFEQQSVYDNVHPEYFKFENYDYSYTDDPGFDYSGGLICSPATGAQLTGKITIPLSYNGKPVIALKQFSGQQITHVFLLEGNELRELSNHGTGVQNQSDGTFRNCNKLQYFDFKNAQKLRLIDAYAFAGAVLQPINGVIDLCSNTYAYGVRAFMNAFVSTTAAIIKVPSSVSRIDVAAISNQDGLAVGSALYLGDTGDYSNFDFNNVIPYGLGNSHIRIRNNTNDMDANGIYKAVFKDIYFYTQKYFSVDEIVFNNKTIAECIGVGTLGDANTRINGEIHIVN